MKLLHTLIHPSITSTQGNTLERQAVRAIVMHGRDILLLYTKRYSDYTLPGGGLDAGETLKGGVLRELREETGAQNVKVGEYLGYLDEYRPHQRDGYDLMFMRSHLFVCEADRELGRATPESYEVGNGMFPVWVDIDIAIRHNRSVLEEMGRNAGLSLARETYLLEYIEREMLALCAA